MMKDRMFLNDLTKKNLLFVSIMLLLLLLLGGPISLISDSWAQDNATQNTPNWYDIIKKGNMDELQDMLLEHRKLSA